jgi:hypothetical protein
LKTNDGLVVTLRASKTDQAGEGTKKGIPYGSTPHTCPVQAVRAWKELAALTEGPLFRPINRHGQVCLRRLAGHAVATIVKKAVGDILRFPTPKRLVGYSGLGARVLASGAKSQTGGSTKQGRRELHSVLVEAAHAGIQISAHWRQQSTTRP